MTKPRQAKVKPEQALGIPRDEYVGMRAAYRKAGVRADSWQNLWMGTGVQGIDKLTGSSFTLKGRIGYNEQFALYRENWLAGRQVDDLADDMTRAGFTFNCTEEPELAAKVYEAWGKIHLLQACKMGCTWAFVCGGAVGLLLTDDETLAPDITGALLQPLDPSQMNGIQQIVIVDSRYAVPDLSSFTSDPTSPNFGNPAFYQVTPFGYSASNPSYRVHWSRIARFEGVPTDNLTRVGNLTWGDSIYQRSYDALMRYGMAYSGAAITAAEFNVKNLKMADLLQNMGGSQEDYEKILNRVNGVKLGLGAARIALTDKDYEELSLMQAPVSGLHEILDRLKEEATGAIRDQMSRLFGTQAGALASAQTDRQNRAAYVHGWQISRVVPVLTYITNLIFQSKDGPRPTNPNALWEIVPNPIEPPDFGKELANRDLQSKIDERDIRNRILEPSEARKSRYGGARYSYETTLDPSITKSIEENDKAALAASTATEDEITTEA